MSSPLRTVQNDAATLDRHGNSSQAAWNKQLGGSQYWSSRSAVFLCPSYTLLFTWHLCGFRTFQSAACLQHQTSWHNRPRKCTVPSGFQEGCKTLIALRSIDKRRLPFNWGSPWMAHELWSTVHSGDPWAMWWYTFCCSDYFAFAFWKYLKMVPTNNFHFQEPNTTNATSANRKYASHMASTARMAWNIYTMSKKHALLVMAATSLLDSSKRQVLERRATACNQGATIWLAWPAKLLQQESIDSPCGLCQSCYQLILGDQSTLFVAAWPKSRLHAEHEGIARTWRHSVPMKPSLTRRLASPQVSHWPSEPQARWA